MSGVGGSRKRNIEQQERIDWILDRVKIGMSKPDIIRQIENRYQLSTTQSRVWYHKANDSLISIDKEHRPRVRSSMLEVVHSQIIGLQQDIGKLSAEIRSYEENRATRETIQAQLIDAGDREREQLKRELAAVKPLKPRYYLDCINQRARLRIAIVKCVTEIGRLEGLYVEELPVIRALSVLGNSELIPAKVAGSLIDILSNLELALDSVPQKVTARTADLN
jgi:RNA polymerase-binding transcription factor DksA